MLKCSICGNIPTRQCSSCNSILLCSECSYFHFDDHMKYNTSCLFEKVQIKLSSKEINLLKIKIRSANEAIDLQKKLIIKETSKATKILKIYIKQAFEILENLRREYNSLNNKIILDENEFIKAKEILKKNLMFEYPCYTQIEGTLTKISKLIQNNLKGANTHIIESEYGLLIQGHTSEINSLVISSDNKYLVSGSGSYLDNGSDNTIRIWNLLERRQELVFQGHTGPVKCVAITSDNKFVISGAEDSTLRIWNLNNKTQEAILFNRKENIASIAISSDDTFIVCGSDNKSIIIWNLITKTKYSIMLEGHFEKVNCVTITTDNEYVVFGSNKVRVLSLRTNQQVIKFKKNYYFINCVAIFKDNCFVASSDFNNSNPEIVIWDLNEEYQEAILQGHKTSIKSIAITKDDLVLVSISNDKIIIMWDLLTYNKQFLLYISDLYDPCIAIANDSSFFVTSSCKCIKLWNFVKRKQIFEFLDHNSVINNIIISEDNHYLVSVSNVVVIWNILEKRQEVLKITPSSIAISIDNRYLVLGNYNISVWNIIEKTYEVELKGHKGIINSVTITDDNRIVISGSDDKSVRLWNLSKKQQIAVLKGHKSKLNAVVLNINNLCFSISLSELILWNLDDKKPPFESLIYKIHAINMEETICIISTSINQTILYIYNLIEKQQVPILEGFKGIVKSVVIASDNNFFVLASSNSSITLWNIPEKRLEAKLKGHLYSVNCIALTSDNRYAISGSDDKSLIIWDLITKEKVAVLIGHDKEINYIEITSTDNFAISSSGSELSDNNIIIWDLVERKLKAKVKKYNSNLSCFAKIGYKDNVVVGYCEGKILILNLRTKKFSLPYKLHTKKIKNVGITEDNKFLVSESDDNTVVVWDFESGKKMAILKIPDNIPFTGVYTSKIYNKVYLSSGFGISAYDIEENTMNHILLFDENFENLYNKDLTYEELLMPQIIYSD
ncbi:hypothetical protein SteCoe_19980 [Stentor coeruleus]|uniref:Uncharacterized protein n=1 Tax=Stentor coeruleus TaxID=5963 RepID=A0A1R2BT19_9CILI|nr:hypothetical protein SteCoe_19980 [Stentor coeruleus]